jgi:hypothetical protein
VRAVRAEKGENMQQKTYHTPRLLRLGDFAEFTRGATGSLNDGQGGGTGMSEDDGMGGVPMVP